MTHPAVRDLFQTLSRHPAFQDLAGKLLRREAGPFSLAGLTPTAKALYLVLLWQATERPLLVVADGNQRAELLAELIGDVFRSSDFARRTRDARSCFPRSTCCPARSSRRIPKSAEQRAIGLWRMANGHVPITIAPVGVGAAAHACRGLLPAARAGTARRRRTAARHDRGASAIDRL